MVSDAHRQDCAYLGPDHRRNERRTWIVTAICSATLVAQVAGGLLFRSMALTASGLHMAAHVAALLVAAGAYALARHHAVSPRFAFGTGKFGYLAGFANALVLGMTAVLIAVESVQRLFTPEAADYASALPLAVAGQCGYCLSGILIGAKALLDANSDPSRAEIAKALSWHLCRCGVHNRVMDAVALAARRMRKGVVT